MEVIGELSDLEGHHEQRMIDAACRGHSVGSCPDCPEDICGTCKGVGTCVVAAVDASDGGAYELTDRKITIPCVSCRAGANADVRWGQGTCKEIRLYRPDGEVIVNFIVPSGQDHEYRMGAPHIVARVTVKEVPLG